MSRPEPSGDLSGGGSIRGRDPRLRARAVGGTTPVVRLAWACRALWPAGPLGRSAALGQEHHWTERHSSAGSRTRARRSDTQERSLMGNYSRRPDCARTPAGASTSCCDGLQGIERRTAGP